MITKELFNSLFPVKGLSPQKYNLVKYRTELISALNKFLPLYAVTTYLRLSAFFSCCGVETDYFKTTEEYASGAAYDTRTDLGNTPQRDGDGELYKGSSLIQTTGLYNFWRVTVRFVKKKTGKDWSVVEKRYKNFAAYTKSEDYLEFLKEASRLGVNFIERPEMLRDNIEIAVEAACIFWEENNLNKYADEGRIKELNGIVNRGSKDLPPLHWAKRNELYSLCKRRVPKDFSFPKPVQSKPAMTLPNGDAAVQSQPSDIVVAQSNKPVVLTPAEPNVEPAKDDSFLSAAFDKNVSGDEVKTVARSAAPRILARFARPFVMLYAALEAGNVYAWLGVLAGVIAVGLLVYWHRNDFLKILNSIKTKFST